MSQDVQTERLVEVDPHQLLTTAKAAKRLNISVRTLIRWTNAHKIKKVQFSDGCTRYDPKDVDSFVKKSRV